jgi:hypothetical protein
VLQPGSWTELVIVGRAGRRGERGRAGPTCAQEHVYDVDVAAVGGSVASARWRSVRGAVGGGGRMTAAGAVGVGARKGGGVGGQAQAELQVQVGEVLVAMKSLDPARYTAVYGRCFKTQHNSKHTANTRCHHPAPH